MAVEQGSGVMAESGQGLIKETHEFIKISDQVLEGMNDIISGAMSEIQAAVSHVDEMSMENERNFNGLKQETEKFKVSMVNEKKKILVVDDDATHITATKGMLEEKYEVVTAQSGTEALSLFFQGLVPHLVLLDLIMPGMDGWYTYDRIRAISDLHHVPIAFFTSSEDPEHMARARQLGVADFIRKPTKKSELIERLDKLIVH